MQKDKHGQWKIVISKCDNETYRIVPRDYITKKKNRIHLIWCVRQIINSKGFEKYYKLNKRRGRVKWSFLSHAKLLNSKKSTNILHFNWDLPQIVIIFSFYKKIQFSQVKSLKSKILTFCNCTRGSCTH